MSTPHSSAAPKILVADDDELLSAVVATSLELHGYRVDCAPRGRVPRGTPVQADLVILDAHVPGEDFESTVASLRQQAVPFLVVSGEFSPPDGIDPQHYLAKPVDLESLLGAVARLVSTGSRR